MLVLMSRKWWVLALRGLAGVLFGLAAFVWPGITLLALVTLFGVYALVDGILALVTALTRDTGRRNWWALLAEGLAGIAIGIVTFIWPGITAFGLLYLIAFWALITGVFEIITAIMLRREIAGEWMMALAGVLSIAFALLLVIYPLAGAMSVLWIIGSYAIFFGVLMIVLAFRLRHLQDSGGHLHQTPSPAH
ncbi:MAG: HdeD family acid-resistance protein [Blastocatellia bacterium]